MSTGGGDRLAESYVELTLRSEKAERGMDRIKKRTQAMDKTVTTSASGFKAWSTRVTQATEHAKKSQVSFQKALDQTIVKQKLLDDRMRRTGQGIGAVGGRFSKLTNVLNNNKSRVLEATRGFDDFVTVLMMPGMGLAAALRASANNATTLLAGLNPLVVIAGTLAVTLGVSLIPKLFATGDAAEKVAEDQLAKYRDALKEIRQEVENLRGVDIVSRQNAKTIKEATEEYNKAASTLAQSIETVLMQGQGRDKGSFKLSLPPGRNVIVRAQALAKEAGKQLKAREAYEEEKGVGSPSTRRMREALANLTSSLEEATERRRLRNQLEDAEAARQRQEEKKRMEEAGKTLREGAWNMSRSFSKALFGGLPTGLKTPEEAISDKLTTMRKGFGAIGQGIGKQLIPGFGLTPQQQEAQRAKRIKAKERRETTREGLRRQVEAADFAPGMEAGLSIANEFRKIVEQIQKAGFSKDEETKLIDKALVLGERKTRDLAKKGEFKPEFRGIADHQKRLQLAALGKKDDEQKKTRLAAEKASELLMEIRDDVREGNKLGPLS